MQFAWGGTHAASAACWRPRPQRRPSAGWTRGQLWVWMLRRHHSQQHAPNPRPTCEHALLLRPSIRPWRRTGALLVFSRHECYDLQLHSLRSRATLGLQCCAGRSEQRCASGGDSTVAAAAAAATHILPAGPARACSDRPLAAACLLPSHRPPGARAACAATLA